jgi:hypothetical protein
LSLFSRYGYVEIIKYLTTKTLLCRLSIGSVLSVYGPLFREWRIETFIWRYMHVWKLRRGIFFPNMAGRKDSVLAPKFRRDYVSSLVM